MPKYEFITRDSKGEHNPVSHPSNQFHHSRTVRAKAPTKSKKREVKLSMEIWSALSMRNWFLNNVIHADHTDWIIHFDTPNRKMTAADQLYLMLQPDRLKHTVRINYNRKHMIIQNIDGNE